MIPPGPIALFLLILFSADLISDFNIFGPSIFFCTLGFSFSSWISFLMYSLYLWYMCFLSLLPVFPLYNLLMSTSFLFFYAYLLYLCCSSFLYLQTSHWDIPLACLCLFLINAFSVLYSSSLCCLFQLDNVIYHPLFLLVSFGNITSVSLKL